MAKWWILLPSFNQTVMALAAQHVRTKLSEKIKSIDRFVLLCLQKLLKTVVFV